MTNIQVHTGNILDLIDLKLNTEQSIDKEIAESVKISLIKKYGESLEQLNNQITNANGKTIYISRDSPFVNVSPEDKKAVRTSVKVFLTSFQPDLLRESVDSILKHLDQDTVDNIILAYKHEDITPENLLVELKSLWSILEIYVDEKKICRIGICDLHEDIFIKLYNEAKVKPSIIQISISSCCIVPPVLQEFTKENVIQLLTHSDPKEILSQPLLSDIFKKENVEFKWAVRYQAHVMCRGVLVSKGFVVSALLK